ncbi:hypothetical protein ACTFIR_001016 [Dictyostelium discoideum]
MGNFKHSFEERPTLKDSKDAKCIYKMNNDLLKEELLDVYGLRENLGFILQNIKSNGFILIKQCYWHNELLNYLKRMLKEFWSLTNTNQKNIIKNCFSKLPSIDGVSISDFDFTNFVGKEFSLLLETLSIALTMIPPSKSVLIDKYKKCFYLQAQYLKLLFNSKNKFITKEEKETANKIINLIVEQRDEYYQISKIVKTKIFEKININKKLENYDMKLKKYVETGFITYHCGLHGLIEVLEKGINPIDSIGQSLESFHQPTKSTELKKSNHISPSKTILRNSNLLFFLNANADIKVEENFELKCYYIINMKCNTEYMANLLNFLNKKTEEFRYTAINNIKLISRVIHKEQIYEKGTYISVNTVDYNEIMKTEENEKSYARIFDIVLIDGIIHLILHYCLINEYHTCIGRIIYQDYDPLQLDDNASIADFGSVFNRVDKWLLFDENIHSSLFAVIDKKSEFILDYKDEDFSENSKITKTLIKLNQINCISKIFNGKFISKGENGERFSFIIGKRSLFEMSSNDVLQILSNDCDEGDVRIDDNFLILFENNNKNEDISQENDDD